MGPMIAATRVADSAPCALVEADPESIATREQSDGNYPLPAAAKALNKQIVRLMARRKRAMSVILCWNSVGRQGRPRDL